MCGYRKYGPVYIVWFNPEPIDINCFINVNTISLLINNGCSEVLTEFGVFPF